MSIKYILDSNDKIDFGAVIAKNATGKAGQLLKVKATEDGLEYLAQGSGGGLDADTVDGKHASDLIAVPANSAQGDILYRDATGWTRLPAGTSGYFLKTQGANADPAWDVATATRLRTGLDANKPATGNNEGDVWYATDTDKFYIWDGTAWLEMEKTSRKGQANGYCDLDASTLVPLARIPATLTGKDADTVDGSHGADLEKIANKGVANGYASLNASSLVVQNPASKGQANGLAELDANSLVPLVQIPATLTGKDADTVDGKHASDLIAVPANSAQGDILYRDATGWTRLPAGTSGYFLKTQGANADPIWVNVREIPTPLGIAYAEDARNYDIPTTAYLDLWQVNYDDNYCKLYTELTLTGTSVSGGVFRVRGVWFVDFVGGTPSFTAIGTVDSVNADISLSGAPGGFKVSAKSLASQTALAMGVIKVYGGASDDTTGNRGFTLVRL